MVVSAPTRAAAPSKPDREGAPVAAPAMRGAWAEAARNFAWANAHPEVWGAYPGHWVAVADQRLVLADANRARFVRRLRAGQWKRAGCDPYVFYVPTAAELTAVHPVPHPVAQPVDQK